MNNDQTFINNKIEIHERILDELFHELSLELTDKIGERRKPSEVTDKDVKVVWEKE